MQANIYRFYLQEFFCQKLNVCQKNIRLGDIMTVMTSQYLHHKKNWLVAFYHQSEANMLVKMGSSSPIFRVNMLKIRELPPARKTSTPFLDVSSACLRLFIHRRHNGDLPHRPRGVIRDEDARGIFLVRPKRRFVGPRTLCSFKEKNLCSSELTNIWHKPTRKCKCIYIYIYIHIMHGIWALQDCKMVFLLWEGKV